MMEFQIPNFLPAAPEITLAAASLLILLLISLVRRNANALAFNLAQASLLVSAVLTVVVGRGFSIITDNLLNAAPAFAQRITTFSGLYLSDPLGDLLKVLVCLVVMVLLVYGRRYLRERHLESAEYYLLILFATLGIMVLVSAGSLLTVYIGLELLSLASYALVAINRDSLRSTEAAMKYFVLGALATGLLLYGMSMVYGATQSLNLTDIHDLLVDPQAGNRTVLLFGLVFVVAGVAFKLGVVPFHMWIPDVYDGAPTSVTLFIATASKIAAFALTCRLLAIGLWDLVEHWRLMLLLVAAASIVLGNLAAIAQTSMKRMLAYSGISHMGFLLLGFASVTVQNPEYAQASALFYVLTYVLTTLGAFGIMLMLSRAGFESDTLEDFRGLGRRSGWWAAMMAMLMFSMAGLPFFVGFFAKFFVLQALWFAGFPVLAVLAVVMSLIGAFYYLRVVKIMFFDEPADTSPLRSSGGAGLLLSVNALSVAVLGIFPGMLMQVCLLVSRYSLP